jgi:hypothetical protein
MTLTRKIMVSNRRTVTARLTSFERGPHARGPGHRPSGREENEMSREDNRRHRSRGNRHLHLDLRDVTEFRRNEGDPKALERIYAACNRWIFDHVSRTLSHADREDFVDSALLPVIQELQSTEIPPETFRHHLEQQLDDQREERERHRSLFTRLTPSHEPLPSPRSPDDDLHLNFWVDVVAMIEQYLFAALLSLSEQDQDLLVQTYGLDDMADPTRPRVAIDFVSASARRGAVYRARTRFSKHLEAMLVAALDLQKAERTHLEAALRIVRGKAVAKALEAVKGLRQER